MELTVKTERLCVAPWPQPSGADMLADVSNMLTPAVLAPLPPGLQDAGDPSAWIAARHATSAVFSIRRRADRKVIGMVQLADDADAATPTLRLGYLLAETAWRQGYGTEAVGGLLAALKEYGPVTVIAGAIASNLGSIRILEKCGFICVPHPDASDMVVCKLSLSPTEP